MSERQKTEAMIQEWSKKSKRSVEDIMKMVEAKLIELQGKIPGKDSDYYERRARFLVYREIKSFLRFPGMVSMDALFFGYDAKIDVFARRRRDAIALYGQNPAAAIDQQRTKPDGTPIYKMPSGNTVDISNPVYMRSVVGLGRPSVGGPIKWLTLSQRRDQVNNLPPMISPVRFSGNKSGEIPYRYSINTIRDTKYEPTEMKEFSNVSPQGIYDLLVGAPAELRANLSTIKDWHDKNQSDRARVVIIEGDVVFIRRQPTSIGNYMMVIEDETLMDLDAEGMTCWVHGDIYHMLNFGAGSRVVAIGRTSTMPGYNRETRTVDRTVTRIGLNCLGIYAEPSLRVPSEEEGVFSA